jgi:hypothetical protein
VDFDPSRLRSGELIAGASGILLLAFVFFMPWYGIAPPLGWTAATLGVSTTRNGWDGLMHLRWLIVLTGVSALALLFYQATRRAPAIPVSISVITTVLAVLTSLALIYRVLINVPGPDDLVNQKVGAYLGLISALGVLYGAFTSLRREGITPKDGPTEIEAVRLQGAGGS